MNIKLRLTSENLICFSVQLMIILTCLPVSMCLPGLLRGSLQVLAMVTFILALFFYRDKKFLIIYVCMVVFFLTYVYEVWHYVKNFTSCLFSVAAGVEFCIYALYAWENKESISVAKVQRILIIIFTITSVTTIIGLIRFPLAARELGRATIGYDFSVSDFDVVKREYRLNNIASWSQIYGMVFFAPNYVIKYKYQNRKKYLFFLMLMTVCIIMSQITMATLLLIMILFFLVYEPPKNRKMLIMWILMSLTGVIAVLFLDELLLGASNILQKQGFSLVASKLYDAYLLTRGQLVGNASGRMLKYTTSLSTFFQHPYLGRILIGNNSQSMFSHHTDILDLMAYYGISGVIILGFIMWKYIQYLYNTIRIHIWYCLVLFCSLIGLAVLNPIWYSPQIYIGAIMLPIMEIALYKKVNVEKV